MLIFPQEKEILLTFERGMYNYVGIAFSVLGLLLLLLQLPGFKKLREQLSPAWLERLITGCDDSWEGKVKKIGITKLLISLTIILLILFALIFYHSRNYNSFYLMKRARQAYGSHNYVKAVKLFGRVVKLQENLGAANEAGLFYALSLNAQGRYTEALKAFDQFIAEYPSSYWTPQAYFELAWTYQALGQQDKAIKAYQDVVRNFPQTVWKDYALKRLKKLR
ncbi:hypothetical protein A2548_07875 [candidate division WOR-1 bacterium RIFOXYD2_FULL_41_8]|nr:MAG: hypothetical protein A2548_07875 [candidate division WOR-1 bacterium RIFOXYD2_FULL_41_8]